MPGLLSFHAHPDDEVLSGGLALIHHARDGEQVVVVTATDGAEGEIHNYENPDELRPRLAELRAQELLDSLEILGVEQHEFLGYRDSGMMGTEANDHPDSFWQADHFEATSRLVSVIRKYRPEVVTIYDPFGGYGHPDHIQVHRIGMSAFFGATDEARFPGETDLESWAPLKLYWSVWPRSWMTDYARHRLASGNLNAEDADRMSRGGVPDDLVTTWLENLSDGAMKEKALRAHRTQIPDDWPLLTLPSQTRREMFGRDAFVRVHSRVDAPSKETDLFAGLR